MVWIEHKKNFCVQTFITSNVNNKRNLFQGYLKSLGMARTAEVKRDARIGEGN